MAQKRYFEFKDDDKTISLNNWLMGITESGVYAGFDFQRQSGLTFKLIHTSTGQVVNNADNVPSLPMGVLVTKTGAVIKEDEELSFVFTANGSTSKRTDTVYAEHTYIKDSIGGIQCTYGVLVGTTTLPNPNNQVAIGYLRVKGLATDTLSTSVTFEKAKRPFPKNGAYNSQKSDVFSFPMTGTTTTRIITLEDDLRTRTVQIEDNAVLPKRILIQSKSASVDFNYSKTYREFHFIIPPIVNADKDFTLSIGTYYINGVEENFDFLVLTADELMNSGQIVVHCTDKALISVTKSIPAIERQRYAVIEANNTIPIATVQDFTIPDGLGEPTNRIAKYEDILSKTPRYLKVPNTRLGGIELNSTPVTGTTMSIEVTSATGMLLESNLNTDAQILGGITTAFPGFAFKKIQHSNDNVPLFYKQGSVIELRYNSYGKWSLLNEGQDDADKQLEDGLLAKTADLNAVKKFYKSVANYTYLEFDSDGPFNLIGAGEPDQLIHTITLPSDGVSRFIEIKAKCNVCMVMNSVSPVYTRMLILLRNADGGVVYTSGEIKTKYVEEICGLVDVSYCFNHAGDGGVYKVWFRYLNGSEFYLRNVQSKAIGTPNVVF